MWGARNYNSVLKLSPEERWVQVQINFRLPQQRQSILNEDVSKMLLKGPKVSCIRTHTHTSPTTQTICEKSPYLNYTQDLKQCPCLPGTAFNALFSSSLIAPHPLYNHSSLVPLPPPNVSFLSDVSLINSAITSGLC